MQLDMFWAFILIFAVDSIAPGPAVAMVMSRAASVGLSRTFPLIAGLVIGDLMLFGMALLGLVALVKTLGPLFFLVKWIGVAYLLYMAYCMWTVTPADIDSTSVEGSVRRRFLLALFLPLGNPKAVGFYVALLPAFMDVQALTMTTAIIFGLSILLIWGLVLTGYAAAAVKASRRFKSSLAQQWLNKASAGAMVGAAGAVAFQK